MTRYSIAGLMLASLALTGCDSSSDSQAGSRQGVIVDDAVGGLSYVTPTQLGHTDSRGRFRYRPGENVDFRLAGQLLGTAPGARTVLITDLLGIAPDADPLPRSAINLARLLQSLDVDAEPRSGIAVPAAVREATVGALTFDLAPAEFETQDAVQQLLALAGRSALVSETRARTALQRSLDHVIAHGVANERPLAVATPDALDMAEGSSALLSSIGTDTDGAVVSHRWDEISNVGLTLSGRDTADVTVTAPNVAADTAARVRLTVTDDDGAIETTTVTIVIRDGHIDNQPPVADAGAAQTVDEEETVTLDGTASSDPDGTIVAWRWQEASSLGVQLNDAQTPTPSFVAPQVEADADAVIRLTVTDDAGDTDAAEVVIRIRDVIDNQLPDALAMASPDPALSGQTAMLDGRGSTDADGDVVSWQWSRLSDEPVFTIDNAGQAQASFTAPPVDSPTTLRLRLRVTDDAGGSGIDDFTVTVNPDGDNAAPSADAGDDQSVDEGAAVTLDASASSDPDGDALGYAWEQVSGTPSVTLDDDSAAMPGFTAPQVEQDSILVFEVTVSDGRGGQDSDQVQVTVRDTGGGGNTAPTAAASAEPEQPVPGQQVTLDGSGSGDAETPDMLSYAWSEDSDCGLSFADAMAQTTTTDAPDEAGRMCTVRLRVTDPDGLSDEATASFTVVSQSGEVTFEDCLESVGGDFAACQELFEQCSSDPGTGQQCLQDGLCALADAFGGDPTGFCPAGAESEIDENTDFAGDGKSVYQVQLISQVDESIIGLTVFEPAGYDGSADFPLLLHGHGFGASRSQQPCGPVPAEFQGGGFSCEGEGYGGTVAGNLQHLIDAGYWIISIDQRGFGESNADIALMDPERDGADLVQIVNWAEAMLPDLAYAGDNLLLGATGGSYGGGYQLLLTAIDPQRRLDAIVPQITWNDLNQSLLPNGFVADRTLQPGVPKSSYAVALAALGLAGGRGSMLVEPFQDELIAAGTTNSASQRLRDELARRGFRRWCEMDGYLADRNPDALFIQGMADVLFTYGEAWDNMQCLRANGADARFFTYQLGHALPTGAGLALPGSYCNDPACYEDYVGLLSPDFDQAGESGFFGCGQLTAPQLEVAWLNAKLKGDASGIAGWPDTCVALDSFNDTVTLDDSAAEPVATQIPEFTAVLDALQLIATPAPLLTLGENAVLAGIPTATITLASPLELGLIDVPELGVDDPIVFIGLGHGRGEAQEQCHQYAAQFDPSGGTGEEFFCDTVIGTPAGIAGEYFSLPANIELIDDQVVPLRGFGTHTIALNGIGERLVAGEQIQLLLFGYHPLFSISGSRQPEAFALQVSGTVNLPLHGELPVLDLRQP